MSAWDDEVELATNKVEQALFKALLELNGTTLTKFVVAFEVINADGERQLASMASQGLMKWDVSGMLTHLLQNDTLDSLRQLIEGNEGDNT